MTTVMGAGYTAAVSVLPDVVSEDLNDRLVQHARDDADLNTALLVNDNDAWVRGVADFAHRTIEMIRTAVENSVLTTVNGEIA